MNVVINGTVLLLPLNGIPRYAGEIVCYLDKNAHEDLNIEIVVPKGKIPDIRLKRIRYVELPDSFKWDYLQAEKYAKKKNALYIYLTIKGVFYKNSIVTIHDIRPVSFDKKTGSLKDLIYKIKFWGLLRVASRNAGKLVTVSEFCKKEIEEYGKRTGEDIEVIGDGWDHILEVIEDDSIFEEFPEIKKGDYYVSIGSIAPHKNFSWIIQNAKKNKDRQYVIIGRVDTSLWADTTGEFGGNIIYVGFQSDEKVKALLKNARALLFPSLYEGFGIPPLEAAGCGIPIVLSDIPVMRELFGDKVKYIDPYDPEIDPDGFMVPVSEVKKTLEEYTWEKQGEKWIGLIEDMR